MGFKAGITAVIDQSVHASSEVFASGRHHPAFATNGEVLGREEGETRHVANPTCLHACCGNRSVGLCSVLDVGDVVLLAPVDQSVVAHLTVEMNGDDRLGLRRPCRFKTGEVDAPVVGFHIHKDGRRTCQGNAGCCRNVGH